MCNDQNYPYFKAMGHNFCDSLLVAFLENVVCFLSCRHYCVVHFKNLDRLRR
jgi:hypothetical protein